MKHTNGKRYCVDDLLPEHGPRVSGYSALYGAIYLKGGGSYTPRRSHGYSAKYGDLGALRRFHPTEKQIQQEERQDP